MRDRFDRPQNWTKSPGVLFYLMTKTRVISECRPTASEQFDFKDKVRLKLMKRRKIGVRSDRWAIPDVVRFRFDLDEKWRTVRIRNAYRESRTDSLPRSCMSNPEMSSGPGRSRVRQVLRYVRTRLRHERSGWIDSMVHDTVTDMGNPGPIRSCRFPGCPQERGYQDFKEEPT